jgi:hypothetical protein
MTEIKASQHWISIFLCCSIMTHTLFPSLVLTSRLGALSTAPTVFMETAQHGQACHLPPNQKLPSISLSLLRTSSILKITSLFLSFPYIQPVVKAHLSTSATPFASPFFFSF